MSELVFESVSKAFGGVKALTDVTMRFAPGLIHSIIGPNGAGKSTIINLAAGSYRASSGSIRLRDAELTHLPKHRIARLGLARTYQNIRLFDDMTVSENLEVTWAWRDEGSEWREFLSARYRTRRHQERRAIIEKTLRDVGLLSCADEQAGSLPYGLQKRAEIARALISEPSVILLDEPAAGLNQAESDELEKLLNDLRDPRRTVIIVEHDMTLVMSVSDSIHVLHQGRLLAKGAPAEISHNIEVQEAYLGTAEHNQRLRAATVDMPSRVRIRAETDIVRHRH